MKWPGLLSTIQIAAGMSMAGPMYVVGLQFLLDGRVLAGVGFVALGLVATYAPTYFVRRVGGPRTWIRRRLRRGGASDATAQDDGSFDRPDDR